MYFFIILLCAHYAYFTQSHIITLFIQVCMLSFCNCIININLQQHIHSKLRTIMLVATKMHVIGRSYAVLTWKCDKENWCSM